MKVDRGPFIKVERAQEHIRELTEGIVAFMDSGPYSIATEKQADKWQLVSHVHREPPPELGAITGDAIHNLRSALDALWYNITHNGRPPSDKRSGEGFVVHEKPESFEARRKTVVKGRLKTAFDILAAIKPYKGGNDLLWRLHLLDIAEKHHVLLLLLGTFEGTRVAPNATWTSLGKSGQMLSYFKIDAKPFHPMKEGEILSSGLDVMPPGHLEEMTKNTQFLANIALYEPGIVEGEAILPLINQMAGAVEGIFYSFRDADLIRF